MMGLHDFNNAWTYMWPKGLENAGWYFLIDMIFLASTLS